MRMQAESAKELNRLMGGTSMVPDVDALMERFRHYAATECVEMQMVFDLQARRGWTDTQTLAWLLYNVACSKDEVVDQLRINATANASEE